MKYKGMLEDQDIAEFVDLPKLAEGVGISEEGLEKYTYLLVEDGIEDTDFEKLFYVLLPKRSKEEKVLLDSLLRRIRAEEKILVGKDGTNFLTMLTKRVGLISNKKNIEIIDYLTDYSEGCATLWFTEEGVKSLERLLDEGFNDS